MNLRETKLTVEIPCSVLHRLGPSRYQYVLLHGYADSPSSMAKRLSLELQSTFDVVLPRGPFPVPQFREGRWRDAFAWYFREGDGSRTLIPPEVGADLVKRSLVTTGTLGTKPIVLVGYSQGGILCPFVARHLEGVAAILQVNSRYRVDEYRGLEHVPIHGIHARNDEIISVDTGFSEHRILMENGFKGSFQVVEAVGHQITDAMSKTLWASLDSLFEQKSSLVANE